MDEGEEKSAKGMENEKETTQNAETMESGVRGASARARAQRESMVQSG